MLLEKPFNSNSLVLTVDNDWDNLHLIKYVVEALNLKCHGINRSEMVLDLAIEKNPKLILLDIVMPRVSGFEVIQQLKANIFTRDIPVIAVTGLTGLYYQVKIKSAGFDDYIGKPFMIEELEAKIAKHMSVKPITIAA